MATLEISEIPAPGLFAAVLHELRNANPRECGIAETLREFLKALTATEARQLPRAIAGVLPLLRGDMERLRFAADVLVRFDLFEAAGELVDVALGCGDHEMALAAAALCGNPAVDEPIRTRVANAVIDSRVGQLRIDGTAQPSTEEEWLLYWQCWPGARHKGGGYPLAPVIVLDSSLDAGAMLRLAARLDDEGASVRRLAREAQMPNWFGPQTVAVCHPLTRIQILNRYPDFSENRLIIDELVDIDQNQDVLVCRINDALPVDCRLRLVAREGHTPPSSTVSRGQLYNEPDDRAAPNRTIDSPGSGTGKSSIVEYSQELRGSKVALVGRQEHDDAGKPLNIRYFQEPVASYLDLAGAQEDDKQAVSSESQNEKLVYVDTY